MTFDIRLWLHPGANPDSDPAGWGLEEDISAYIRRPGGDGGQAISYSGGKGDEAPGVDAGQMQLSLDNRDGRFSTDNALGPYYRRLDINNPVRLGVVSFADTFTRAASASGWGTADAAKSWSWTHANPAVWTTDGTKGISSLAAANTANSGFAVGANAKDVDVRVKVTPQAVATGARFTAAVIVRGASATDCIMAVLGFDAAGAMRFDILRWAGTASFLALLDPLPAASYTAGQQWTIRVQADGQAIRAKAWPTAGTEPATWQLTATDDTKTATGVGVYAGRVVGNTTASPQLSWDDFEAVALEFTGSVVSWPVRWDKSGNNSWAPITAAGILRRIRQGTYPIQSPLRRQLGAMADSTGYWPMEDGPSARQLSSAKPTQTGANFVSVTPASNSDLAGGGQAPTLDTADGFITMQSTKGLTGTGFSVMFFFKLGSVPSTKTKIARIRCSKGNGPRIWDFYLSDTTTWVEGVESDGTILTSASNAHTEELTDWYSWQLETEFAGGSTMNWAGTFHRVAAGAGYGSQTGSFTGLIPLVASSLTLTGPQGTAFAHAWMGLNTLPYVTDSFSLVASGYVGETAAERFARVCTEAGLPYILQPGDSERMGAQREAGTLAVLESCVQTDYGVMAERGSGLEYIPRAARWNAAVAMALTVTAGEIAEAPEPTRDDQRLRNKWTVSRVGGGEGVYQDDDDIARHGTWEDSASVNTMDDSVLQAHAGFRTALGITQRMRWPAVDLDFSRNPSLLPAWRARGYGWRLTVTTGKGQVAGNEPDLIVEGFTATLDPDRWTARLNCSPAEAWRAAVTDDTGILGRADNEYCETTALISSTTLSIPITTTSGTRWDNTAGLWTGGVDFYVDGERVTVTSITNGVNPAQTLNCSARGVGGYQAEHPSGSEVRLWSPAIVAL
jgi:hypothetical protein